MTRWLFRRSALVALFPFVVMIAALMVVYITDITLPSLDKALQNPHVIFGFFAKAYPLFGFVLVYAAARLMMVALTGTRPFILFRALLWLPAMALLLFAAFYPTFGGLVARAGFGGGSFAFLNDLPPVYAQMFGGAFAGGMLALVLGAAHALIDWNWKLSLGRVLRGILAAGSLKWAGLVLVIGWLRVTEGGIAWPEGPMQGSTFLLTLPVLFVALLPHMLVSLWSDRAAQIDARL